MSSRSFGVAPPATCLFVQTRPPLDLASLLPVLSAETRKKVRREGLEPTVPLKRG